MLINILLYADDIAMLAETEENMQFLLYIVKCVTSVSDYAGRVTGYSQYV